MKRKKTNPTELMEGKQVEKVCPHCNKSCRCLITAKLIPKFCYHCGKGMDYSDRK